MKILIMLLILSCGTEETEEVEDREVVEVTVVGNKGDTGNTGAVGYSGVDGKDGDKGLVGDSGYNGSDAVACFTESVFTKTKTHRDHTDYYYDVVMVCQDSVDVIARDVKYHEELL